MDVNRSFGDDLHSDGQIQIAYDGLMLRNSDINVYNHNGISSSEGTFINPYNDNYHIIEN